MSGLETIIRDLAARGELSHLSLVPSGKKWHATFAPCSTYGRVSVERDDPVSALLAACQGAKIKQRAPFKDGDKPGRKASTERKGDPFD